MLYEANTTADGMKVQGYRVSLPGWTDAAGEQVWLKASDVDRKLSWSKLRGELGSDRSANAAAIQAARTVAQGYPGRAEVDADRDGRSARDEAAARLARLREQRQQQRDQERWRGR